MGKLFSEIAASVETASSIPTNSRSFEPDGFPPSEVVAYFREKLEIHEELGRGGFGVVYRVTHRTLAQTRALKVISLRSAQISQVSIDRILREPRSLARLQHPNIVAVFDAGTIGDYFYVLMEYVAGQTLAQRIRAGDLPKDFVFRSISDIGAALSFAHENGVIHRDVSPNNILVTPEGEVKLVDFGLSKGSVADTEVSEITRENVGFGTPTYVSPEQRKNAKDASYSSDIYSLGVVAFELLSGRRLQGAILDRSGLGSPAMTSVVLRCLAEDPEQRFQTGGEFCQAWGRALAKGHKRGAARLVPSSPDTKGNRVRSLGFAFLALVVILGMFPSISQLWENDGIRVLRIEGVRMAFLEMEPGPFRIGSEDCGATGESCPPISGTFEEHWWFGVSEVTWNQYEAALALFPEETAKSLLPVGLSNRPRNGLVEGISWRQAIVFSRNLTEIARAQGRLTRNERIRLTTEVEWEFGAAFAREAGDAPIQGIGNGIGERCLDWYWFYEEFEEDPHARFDRALKPGATCRDRYGEIHERDFFGPDEGEIDVGFRLVIATEDPALDRLVYYGEEFPIRIGGLEFYFIPAGAFTVEGDPTSSATIQVSSGFWMATTEVTREQFSALFPNSGMTADDYPVAGVTWNEAVGYCETLTAIEKERLPEGFVVRLPTEAEWEHACKCEYDKAFYFLSSRSDPNDLGDKVIYSGNSGGEPREVFPLSANPWGLRGMHGNVREWCLDWFSDSFENGGLDVLGTVPGVEATKVTRGGHFAADPHECSSSFRSSLRHDTASERVGFRPVIGLASVAQRVAEPYEEAR